MFTGIIEKTSEIININEWRFTLENVFGDDLQIGQSIAHDGACMTVESFDSSQYTFFIMQESLKKTNFWTKKAGDFINIERCLQVDSRIDGHFASGHIDTSGKVSLLEKQDDSSLVIGVSFSREFSKLWKRMVYSKQLSDIQLLRKYSELCRLKKRASIWSSFF